MFLAIALFYALWDSPERGSPPVAGTSAAASTVAGTSTAASTAVGTGAPEFGRGDLVAESGAGGNSVGGGNAAVASGQRGTPAWGSLPSRSEEAGNAARSSPSVACGERGSVVGGNAAGLGESVGGSAEAGNVAGTSAECSVRPASSAVATAPLGVRTAIRPCFVCCRKLHGAPEIVLFAALALAFKTNSKYEELLRLEDLSIKALVQFCYGVEETICFIFDEGGAIAASGFVWRPDVHCMVEALLTSHAAVYVRGLESAYSVDSCTWIARPFLTDKEFESVLLKFHISVDGREHQCGVGGSKWNFGLLMGQGPAFQKNKLDRYESAIKWFIAGLDSALDMLEFSKVLGRAATTRVAPFGAVTGCFYSYDGTSSCISEHLEGVAHTYFLERCVGCKQEELLDRVNSLTLSMDPMNMRSTGWLVEKAALLVMSGCPFPMPDPASPWIWRVDRVKPFKGTFNWKMLLRDGTLIMHLPLDSAHEAIDNIGEMGNLIIGWQISCNKDPEASHKDTRRKFLSWFDRTSGYKLVLGWIGDFGVLAPSSTDYATHTEVFLNFETLHPVLDVVRAVCRTAHGAQPATLPQPLLPALQQQQQPLPPPPLAPPPPPPVPQQQHVHPPAARCSATIEHGQKKGTVCGRPTPCQYHRHRH